MGTPDDATTQSDALLAQIRRGTWVVVPALWPLELANALVVLERRKKLTTQDRIDAFSALRSLVFAVDHEMPALAFTVLSQLASELVLNVYDAAYLELAVRLNLPLACRDGPLREAARQRGVQVVS